MVVNPLDRLAGGLAFLESPVGEFVIDVGLTEIADVMRAEHFALPARCGRITKLSFEFDVLHRPTRIVLTIGRVSLHGQESSQGAHKFGLIPRLDTEFLRLIELGTRIFTRNNEIGLRRNRTGDLRPERFEPFGQRLACEVL